MLARKGIFATPSIDTVLERVQKSASSCEFYKIKFGMCQLYAQNQKKARRNSLLFRFFGFTARRYRA